MSLSFRSVSLRVPQKRGREERSAPSALREINRLLVANGLPRHAEPETLPRMRNRYAALLAYDWIHYLRRAIAFARQNRRIHTCSEGRPIRRRANRTRILVSIESHVICHPIARYYVPVDFRNPLYHDSDDEIAAGFSAPVSRDARTR